MDVKEFVIQDLALQDKLVIQQDVFLVVVQLVIVALGENV